MGKEQHKTVDDLMLLLAHVTWLYGLGVLVIDEIQRLVNAKGSDAEGMLGFLVYLVNMVGVPIILIGTYKAIDLLSKEFAEARRAAGQGDMIWSHLPKNEVWDLLIESIFRYQFTKTPTRLSAPLSDALYEESQGIVDIAVKLYMFAQWEVIGYGNEIITPQLISRVARKYLNLAGPILDALRKHDYERLKAIGDIKPALLSLDQFMEQARQPTIIEGDLASLRNVRISQQDKSGSVDFFVDYVTKVLLETGYDVKVANECARKALDRHANEKDLKKVMLEAHLLASQYQSNRDKKETKKGSSTEQPPHLPGDLRTIATQKGDASSNYNDLKKAGKVKAAKEFL